MELLQLKYFRTAARCQNFSRAAEKFSVPQSSISKTVANLEDELGCKLFTRSGRHVHLNEQGKAFLKKVDLALDSLEDGITELAELMQQQRENIKLAVWESSKLLPELLTAFRKTNGKASFSLIQHADASGFTDNFDLSISSLPLADDRLDYTPLVTEEIVVAVPIHHPLAQHSHVSLDEIRNESFISLTSSKSLRRMTDSYCSLYGYLPKVIFESDDAGTVRGLIENGLGVTFIPFTTWRPDNKDRLKYLHIRDIDCRRTLAVSWYKNSHLSPTALELRQFIIDWYQQL